LTSAAGFDTLNSKKAKALLEELYA